MKKVTEKECVNCQGQGCMNCIPVAMNVYAIYTVSLFDGVICAPLQDCYRNTLPEALDLADTCMKDVTKQMESDGIDWFKLGVECVIDVRVCTTRGTTTQTVHLIS